MKAARRVLRLAAGDRAGLLDLLRNCAGLSRFLCKAELDDASGRVTISLSFQYVTVLACVPAKDDPIDLVLDPIDGGWHANVANASVRFDERYAIRRLNLSYCELASDSKAADRFRLSLNGTLEFKANKEDLASFEALNFFELVFLIGPDGSVETDLSRVRFDTIESKARPGSLCAQLRLVPKRLVSSKSGPLTFQGFDSLDGAYAIPKRLNEPWNALVLGLSLGRLGELADSAELTTELAIGWGPPNGTLFAAMKLPGSDLAGRIGLQGIVGLKPGGSGLRLYDDSEKTSEKRWVLFLRDVQFSLFVLALPPNGGVDVEISGDPEGKGPPSWYCAYAQTSKT